MGDSSVAPSGGAPIKVRVVKGANLAMEHVDAADARLAARDLRHQAGLRHQLQARARLVDDARAHRRRALGVAGHNLFDVAHAWLTAQRARRRARASSSRCCSAWRPARPRPCAATSGSLLLYTPVVNPSEFDVAIAYLIRRLEENASQDNFMSAVFELADDRGAVPARAGALPRVARGARAVGARARAEPHPEPPHRVDRRDRSPPR